MFLAATIAAAGCAKKPVESVPATVQEVVVTAEDDSWLRDWEKEDNKRTAKTFGFVSGLIVLGVPVLYCKYCCLSAWDYNGIYSFQYARNRQDAQRTRHRRLR